MQQKLLLYFSDKPIILFNSMGEALWVCKEDFETSQTELKRVLSAYPTSPLCFLIDRSQQDIREEKIPSLLPWDRMRLLWHKKEEWKAQGGYFGYHFFKHEGDTYLRWVHIQQKDKLIDWILWTTSLSNPFHQVFFISHEAKAFLEKHVPSLKGYLMFLYSFSPAPIRQLVFQGERLLLSRTIQGEEDIQTSLHFLSRTYPDLHEHLYTLTLLDQHSFAIPNSKTCFDKYIFIKFFASQKCARLSLNLKSLSGHFWLKRGLCVGGISLLLLSGINFYHGLRFRKAIPVLQSEVDALKFRLKPLKLVVNEKDLNFIRAALRHYAYLKARTCNPLQTFQKLSLLLKKEEVILRQLQWRNEQGQELILTFFIKNKSGKALAQQFQAFLASCVDIFSGAKITILQAPYKSGNHEVYVVPYETITPLAQVKIVLP